MKKFFGGLSAALSVGLGAALGIVAAVLLHCSVMTVEVGGSEMLPVLEPGEKVFVWLLTDKEELKAGDLVACEPAVYEIDGGSGPLLRRIESVEGDGFVLCCEARMTEKETLTVKKDDILGKVLW